MTRCTFEGCLRSPVYPDQSRCSDHRLRWLPGRPVEIALHSDGTVKEPEWLRRARANGLPAKDMTGSAA